MPAVDASDADRLEGHDDDLDPTGTRSGRLIVTLVVGVAVVASAPRWGWSQAANDWVGKRVVIEARDDLVRRAGADDKKTGNAGQSDLRHAGRIFRVERANGPWLWIQDEGRTVSGWVTLDDLLASDQALDYYTSAIKANLSYIAGLPRSRAYPPSKQRPGPCTRRLQRGHPARPQGCDGILQPRQRLVRQEGIRQGDRRLRQGDQSRRQSSLRPTTAAATLGTNKKDYDKAIADYDEAIELDPKDAVAYNNRGVAWYAKNEYDKAIADFNEAIRLDPEDAVAYINRGNAWYAKKRI